MTHEAGIEAAAETLVTEMYPDAPDMQGARHSARLIVEAYLSASGMVLVPREPTERMVNAGYGSNHFGDHDPHYAYVRMIADAPDPFKSTPGE
ncbi:hypothetical protein EON76_05110 [bacterium]|nr:MAG: hypothetical protein EON76_05110 [bacterium]